MILKTSLLDYQKQAADKLRKIKVGALYMDTGTGKTRVALELAKLRLDAHKIDKVIWLCPTSEQVKASLIDDFNKHADCWQQDITLCGIETLSTSVQENRRLLSLAEEHRCFLVVDESLLVKNPYALRSRNITRLAEKCPYRAILNGTPISRNYADLFSQWYILDWRILGYQSYWSFAANHLEYDETHRKVRRVLNVDYLTDKIAPYTVQISKRKVLSLFPKKYSTHYFRLTEQQREHYEYVRDDFLTMETLLENPDSPLIYRTFNALQQITSGQRITSPAVKPTTHAPMFSNPLDNPRIQLLAEILDTVVPSTEKCIIWCRFTHEIRDIKRLLEERRESFVLCYGEISKKRRKEVKHTFETSARFLLANKSCAAFSSNLQFSHFAIFYDNDWNWGTRVQAEDRQDRIGQKTSPTIIDICAVETIDVRVLSCLANKLYMEDEFKKRVGKKSLRDWLDGKDELYDKNRTA